MNFKEKFLREGGLNILHSHIKDANTFAIIGSNDKDTHKNRSEELDYLIGELSSKGKIKAFNYILGKYNYKNGDKDVEYSIIAYNITKEDALNLGKKLNQESILYNDKDFFGYINCKDKSLVFPLDRNELNFDPNTAKKSGGSSTLAGIGWCLAKNPKNKNMPFVFEAFFQQSDLSAKSTNNYLIDSFEEKGK